MQGVSHLPVAWCRVCGHTYLSLGAGCVGTLTCRLVQGVWAHLPVAWCRVCGHTYLSLGAGCVGTLTCRLVQGVWAHLPVAWCRAYGHTYLSLGAGCVVTLTCRLVQGVWAQLPVAWCRVCGHTYLSLGAGCVGTLTCRLVQGVWAHLPVAWCRVYCSVVGLSLNNNITPLTESFVNLDTYSEHKHVRINEVLLYKLYMSAVSLVPSTIHCHNSILCRCSREAPAANKRRYQDATLNIFWPD